MEAKEYLEQIYHIDVLIENRRNEVMELAAKCGLQGISFEKREGVGSRDVNRQEKLIIKLMELQDKNESEIIELVDKRKAIIYVIENLQNANEAKILLLKYAKNYSWKQISDALGYSRQNCFKIYARALNSIDEEIKKAAIE